MLELRANPHSVEDKDLLILSYCFIFVKIYITESILRGRLLFGHESSYQNGLGGLLKLILPSATAYEEYATSYKPFRYFATL